MSGRTVRRAAMLAAGAGAIAVIVPATGGAATTAAQAGDFRPPDVGFNAFLPARITVRQGDQVSWRFAGFHTVTFPKRGTRGPAIIRPAGTNAPSANDPAGAPYWWAGLPAFSFNPEVFGPTGGTTVTGATTVNSGVPQGRSFRFTARFPKTGNFTYVCAVHPGMKGSVRVLPRRSAAPKPGVAAARAKRELAALVATAAREARKAARVSSTSRVSVGFGSGPVHLFRFVPSATSVPRGSTVEFRMAGQREIHTVTFGPKQYVQGVARATFDTPGPIINPEGFFPSDPPPSQPVPYTGANHGNGFLNSGVLVAPPAPGPRRFSVRFDTPGTYEYVCIVHPEMTGRVTVT